jgi:hypothetical protein
LLSQSLKKLPVVYEFRKSPFHLDHKIVLACESDLVPYIGMNNISRAAEIGHHRDGTRCKCFKDYARTVVTQRWEYEYICRPQMPEDFCVAEPTGKDDSLFDAKGSHEFLETLPLRSIANHGKAGQIPSQDRSCGTQCKITSLSWNQSADENQLKLGITIAIP